MVDTISSINSINAIKESGSGSRKYPVSGAGIHSFSWCCCVDGEWIVDRQSFGAACSGPARGGGGGGGGSSCSSTVVE